MNDAAKKLQRIASLAVITAFVAFWVIVFAVNEPPEFKIMYLYSAIALAVIATPWVIAARMLVRAWCEQCQDRLDAADGPAMLLAAASAALPVDRRDWGAAMQAELTQVTDRAARWRFAAGGARTALFPPRGNIVPVLVVAAIAIAAAVSAGPAVDRTLPAMRVFAVTFVALVGALLVLVVARSRRVRDAASFPVMSAATVAGVAASIVATAWFLIKNPAAATHFPPAVAAWLAVLLVACLALAVSQPRGLIASRWAQLVGVGAAVSLGAGFVWCARESVHTMGGPLIWILFAPGLVLFFSGAAAASLGRSFAAGVQAAVWAALLGALLIFALALPETVHRFAIDGRTLGDGESGHPIGVNLPGAISGLVQIPVFGFPFGVFGAALGNPRSRRRRNGRARQGDDPAPRSDDRAPLLRKPPPLGGAS